jgi:hypothetical protein
MTALAAAAPATPARPRSRRRRWRPAIAGLLLAAAVTIAASGCTATITPPANVATPATVFLLREAMHTGIVLPPVAGDDQYVEFGYGDWSWFALGNDAWYDAFATVLWPTTGALGRRTFGARTPDELRRRVTWAELHELTVERDRATALREQLQAAFDAGAAAARPRPELGWIFVPDARSYWWANNCADVAAHWFEDVGCTLSWVPIRISLTVAGP